MWGGAGGISCIHMTWVCRVPTGVHLQRLRSMSLHALAGTGLHVGASGTCLVNGTGRAQRAAAGFEEDVYVPGKESR